MIEYTEYKLSNTEIAIWNALQDYVNKNEIDGDIILTYSFGEAGVFYKSFIHVNKRGVCTIDRQLEVEDTVLKIYGYTYLSEVAITHCTMKAEVDNHE